MKHYTYKGKTYTNDIPDPLDGVSPLHLKDGSVNEARFKSMGGAVTEDEQLSPKEKFFTALNDYLDELEDKAKGLALAVTKKDFIEAAANSKISTDLVDWAREKGVPDAMIAEARAQVLTFLADAQRPEIGLMWGDIFPKQPSN